MSDYQPQVDEVLLILNRVTDDGQALRQMLAFSEMDQSLTEHVLTEAATFVAEVIAPLQQVGDRVGAQFKDGQVTMPPGYRQAYQAFWQAGWAGLSAAPEHGGQGLPSVLEAILYEWLSAANHSWTMAPGLLHGAYECIRHHGSEALQSQYLSKLATGQWLATMCLTEAQAGSDLGLGTTRALAQADGSYALSGTKIFISGGEHDLSDNIVHLVLARLPDAPPGPKGLSLFLCPKFYPEGSAPRDESGSEGPARSAVFCERIEEKMGLHGSPTCVMRFDQARAWMVGEPGKGLGAMFLMMNAARLHVALQGIGLLDAAWQKAHAYALERRQMRAPGAARGAASADPIIEHPAIGRILDTQRAWIDGGRLLAYQTALELDRAKHHAEPSRRQQAQRWCSLITPVLKAAWTEQGFTGASACLQVFGGHGYVREWGIEQIVRDARVTLIYEGTNEIQGIDLLLRKVMVDGGQALAEVLDGLSSRLDVPGQDRLQRFRQVTAELLATAPLQAALPYAVADDYLRALALVLLDWSWSQILAAPQASAPRWQAPALALRRHVLPELDMRLAIIEARCQEVRASTAPRAPAASAAEAR